MTHLQEFFVFRKCSKMHLKASTEVQIRELTRKTKLLPNLHLERLYCVEMQCFAF
jgi:hypothetical protein